MKNIAVTVIIGFITGLVLSGIIFDVINYIGKSFNRVSVSWNISKAEKCYSNERFSDAISLYKKVLPEINQENKILIAKTKNNLALSLYNNYKITNNSKEKEEAIELLNQAKDIYLELGEEALLKEADGNLKRVYNQ